MQSLAHTKTMLVGLVGRPQQSQSQPQSARGPAAPQALFGRKAAAPVVEKEAAPAAKRGFLGRTAKQEATPAKQQKSSKPVDKAAEYQKRQGAFGRVMSAMDFAEVRSKGDGELLYEAKYGKRGEDGKMTREQYAALRRRVGGTAKDFWKTSIDVDGEYVDRGYVAKDNSVTASSVPALPFLVGTVAALFGATIYVVSQTS